MCSFDTFIYCCMITTIYHLHIGSKKALKHFDLTYATCPVSTVLPWFLSLLKGPNPALSTLQKLFNFFRKTIALGPRLPRSRVDSHLQSIIYGSTNSPHETHPKISTRSISAGDEFTCVQFDKFAEYSRVMIMEAIFSKLTVGIDLQRI